MTAGSATSGAAGRSDHRATVIGARDRPTGMAHRAGRGRHVRRTRRRPIGGRRGAGRAGGRQRVGAPASRGRGVVGRERVSGRMGESVGVPDRPANRLVIAIDGPAAAGKTTVASAVARRLDALFFDTGVIYRALTLAALEHGVEVDNGLRLAGLARHLDVRVTQPSKDDGRLYDVWMEGRDVTWEIRSGEVDRAVSAVSAHPGVRRALLGVQRRIGRSGRVVMTGRDVGTVVMPDADLKIWLDASLDERARRRQKELAERGVVLDIETVRADMAARDHADASRAVAPMTASPDAVTIDTDGRTIDSITEEIVRMVADHERGR